MKQRLLQILFLFIAITLLFALQKAVFMVVTGGYGFADGCSVIFHAVPMDMCMAGYLTAIPALMAIVSLWAGEKRVEKWITPYFVVIGVLAAMACVANTALYPYWGFPLDTTPLFYFRSSPRSALASASVGQIAGYLAMFLVLADIFFFACYWAYCKLPQLIVKCDTASKPVATAVLIVAAALLFIPIRGGFTVSTMNLSRVYFSPDARLNHAAVNPLFSFMHSATHQSNFKKEFRFMDESEAEKIFAETLSLPKAASDSTAAHLPNVQIIILESFSSHLMPSLGGEAIAINLDSIAQDGWLFDNIYASSFRTDRGLTAILCGYPAQPTTSIMKYVDKTEGLPSISHSLKDLGYSTAYFYGGDANFTNMQAMLVAHQFDKLVSDKDFPISQKLSKWGAHDDVLYQRALADIKDMANDGEPYFAVIQTSSSHEPFEVPHQSSHADLRANAFAYADSCLGDYMRQLKGLPGYDNTIVVIVPDHYGAYPELSDHEQRHRVPLIFAGDALENIIPDSAMFHRIGSQTDIAATLLNIVGADASAFAFSNDLLNPARPEYAFYSEPSWIALSTPQGRAEISVETKQPMPESPDSLLTLLKAYVQTLYSDLDQR